MEAELINTQEGLEGELGYKGERGYSAYEIAVKNGYEGTEQDWIDHFGLDLTDYIQTSDIVDNCESESTTKPLSANQGKRLMNWVSNLYINKADRGDALEKDVNIKVVEGDLTFTIGDDFNVANFYYNVPSDEKWVVLSGWYIYGSLGESLSAPGVTINSTTHTVSTVASVYPALGELNINDCTLQIMDYDNRFTSSTTGRAGMVIMRIDEEEE